MPQRGVPPFIYQALDTGEEDGVRSKKMAGTTIPLCGTTNSGEKGDLGCGLITQYLSNVTGSSLLNEKRIRV